MMFSLVLLKTDLYISKLVNPNIHSSSSIDHGISNEEVSFGVVNIIFNASCEFFLSCSKSVSAFFCN